MSTTGRLRPSRADAILLGLVMLLAVAALPAGALLAAPGGDDVVIEGPAGRMVLPLDEGSRVVIEGACGQMVVSVDDGATSVESSDCPEERCVARGVVGPDEGPIVCVPNAVTITVGGDHEHGMDAVVR